MPGKTGNVMRMLANLLFSLSRQEKLVFPLHGES